MGDNYKDNELFVKLYGEKNQKRNKLILKFQAIFYKYLKRKPNSIEAGINRQKPI